MKKTLIAMFALAGVAMGDSDLTFLGTINLSEGSLPTGEAVSTVTINGAEVMSLFNVTLTASTGNTLTSGTTGYGMTDAEKTTLCGNVGSSTTGFTSIVMTQNSWVGLNSKGADKSLTLTISGLEAGQKYNVSLLSGITKEESGAWNALTTSNTYDSSLALEIGAEKVPAAAMGAWALTGVVADTQGQITFTNLEPHSASGWHTPVFNGVSVAKVNTPVVPEPATATLSLLALAGLAARRRRH